MRRTTLPLRQTTNHGGYQTQTNRRTDRYLIRRLLYVFNKVELSYRYGLRQRNNTCRRHHTDNPLGATTAENLEGTTREHPLPIPPFLPVRSHHNLINFIHHIVVVAATQQKNQQKEKAENTMNGRLQLQHYTRCHYTLLTTQLLHRDNLCPHRCCTRSLSASIPLPLQSRRVSWWPGRS